MATHALLTREDHPDDGSMFSYVMIPSDHTKPMCVLRHRKNTTLEDDTLRDTLKMRFAVTALAEDQMQGYLTGLKGQVAQQSEPGAKPIFNDDTLRKLADSSAVDTFCLTVPTKDNQHAISLYVDEKGSAKELPLNHRANGLANACGAKAQQFRGDCYISRYFDDDEAWLREDFTLDDCSSEAKWVSNAAESAKRRGGGGLASLSSMYDKLGGGANNSKNEGEGPVKFDAVEADKSAMEAEHDGGAYSWTQTDTEVELRIPVPAATKPKDVAVTITRSSVKAGLKVSLSEPLVDIKQLPDKIDPDGSAWTLDGAGEKREIVLTLDKATSGGAWLQLDANK